MTLRVEVDDSDCSGHMTDPRLSTVYDYSNLRLHPDGTRVYQKEVNFRPDLAKITVQGPRSSWIARDAGGSGKIRKSRTRVKNPLEQAKDDEQGEALDGSAEEEEFPDIDEKSDEDEEGEDEDESEHHVGKKRKPKRFNPLVPKRQKFAADFDYLRDASSSTQPPPHAGPSTETTDSAASPNQGPNELDLPDPSPVRFVSIPGI